jgi:poly-gamma-glutamate capsule biosynthesis protein CapA/YwtB (metallophosphatase superfamily)
MRMTYPGISQMSRHAGDLIIAATGDSLITRRLSVHTEPEFLQIVEILRSADAAFTNLETTIHDFRAHPAAESGGTWMASPTYVAEELKWAGFSLLSRANNHSMDWGIEGMRDTTAALDALDMTHAGIGDDLVRARQAAYRNTPAGRIALVSAASTFAPWGRAGNPRKDIQGRPGLNPLRWSKVHLLSPAAYQAMQAIAREAGIMPGAPGKPIHLFDTTFLPWDKTAIGVEALPADLHGNLAAVRQAREQADCVIVSLHTHEDGGNIHLPAPFAVKFGRQCIDNGADLVLMHGAHVLRGIEIYKGKPVFYGLGNFIYQAQQVEKLPADVFENLGLALDSDEEAVFCRFEQISADVKAHPVSGRSPHLFGSAYSVLPILRFSNRRLEEIRLHPVTLGPDMDRLLCGYPRLATGRLADEIIELARSVSAPFGTKLVCLNGCGIIDLPTGKSS